MSVEKSENVSKKKYKMVPPDGGWGYLICVAAVINFTATTSFQGCFGMIFKDLMIELKMTSTNIALMAGINVLSTAIAGFFTSPLLKIMSPRMLTLLATTIYNIGTLSVVFVKSQSLFILCQGVMPGAGLGTLYSLTLASLNDYFVINRVFAISCFQTVTAITAMAMPMLVNWLTEEYGYRGTLLLISGITIHMFLAAVIMQPVEWHMKRIEISNDDQEVQKPLIDSKPEQVKPGPQTDMDGAKELDLKEVEEVIPEVTKPSVLKRIISSLVDVSLCKTYLLSCASFGTAITVCADFMYALMLPQALYSVNWSQDEVAWAISLGGFGDLAMRILFIVLGSWLMKLGSQEIYVLGIALGCIMRLAVQWTHNFSATLVFLTLIGASRCITAILIPIVIADVVRPDQFTEALSLFFITCGFINLVVNPAIGAVQDLTKSYASAFYLLTSLYAIIVLFWSIELYYKKNKHKHVPKRKAEKGTKSNK